ncbi:MAG: acyl-CoA synthetase [Gammaproteobacteria bacterium]|jgi:fatty-acyl-CoA synthase|nr:acyl-CoA synthetase [Gammaproteobacteria bacterium]MBT4193798.1 acyl-CoA synthetase [Gammaproteobacteria bacterium]MBT4449837.1 acyl-CoA synthetase [Gammaproteobacteria bacterium]MBT4862819.1 acyl-CoA synthetase [Gammaproteobacteria bacterium]MBT6455173.1 acyl-CoA synthetase [Gammaproteobacteria bacterium]
MNKNNANFAPLTPVGFLRRAAETCPDKIAVIYGEQRYNYKQFYQRTCRLASALKKRGINRGDTVAVIASNIPAMLEAHYGVPMLGAVLNPLNIQLDSKTISFILQHGEAKVLITDCSLSPRIQQALAMIENPPLVIDIKDNNCKDGELLGELDYEALLAEGDEDCDFSEPQDEWQSACLLYTSGTTGNPKGVVYDHRGAYLNALGNMTSMGLNQNSIYLWSLPMFHCNGWTFTWAVTAACATHICLRKVDTAVIYQLIKKHTVTHMCGAPIVMNMLVNAADDIKTKFDHTVELATGGAAPSSTVINSMEKIGFRITHLYGMTESFGPSLVCSWKQEWSELDADERVGKMARQGIRYVTSEKVKIAHPDTLQEQPWDGHTVGELMLGGNTIMKGYLKNTQATDEAFRGGWLHTGDLGVRHPDGYIEIKDRSKDVIISGGENISSLEVEQALYKHPKILEAAVVAKPHDKWGESPCAFVTLKQGEVASSEDIINFCRDELAHFKIPRTVVFGPLEKTATGKIQKFLLRQQAKELE